MSSLSVRLRQQQRSKALGMLKELAERIVRGDLEVESSGFWVEGTRNRLTFQFHVKESDKFKNPENVG